MYQWFLLVGALLVAMAFASRFVQRLPVSPAMLYLLVGLAIGPIGAAWIDVDLAADAAVIELLAEIAVLVTLFSVGLRLGPPPRWRAWTLPVRLATAGMVVTILFTTTAAMLLLELAWPAALLLAAILAPTDPVLASDVQVRRPGDRDAVRLTLTAEGGLNDGAAFPALMLALGLLGVHALGPWGARWLALDLAWACFGGLAIGWIAGSQVARLLSRLERTGQPAELIEFLVLGVIALCYGLALALHTYGFLAVFAGGLALAKGMRVDERESGRRQDSALHLRVISWTAQSERICEVALVLVVGILLGRVQWTVPLMLFATAMVFVVRPVAAWMTTGGGLLATHQRRLVAWFGIRGIGSLYYLAFALDHGLPKGISQPVADAALIAIALSIGVHGVSATPLMDWYEARRRA